MLPSQDGASKSFERDEIAIWDERGTTRASVPGKKAGPRPARQHTQMAAQTDHVSENTGPFPT
jgi:hypothetical protein